MKGEAVAFGAATIVNAVATGFGAAFGINLWTRCWVELTEDVGVVEAEIRSDPYEDTTLLKKAVEVVLRRYGMMEKFGAKAVTESNIPIARGLKSSSVAANAAVLATLAALGVSEFDDVEVVKMGVDAAVKAGVTITGAFDDACASFFGNVVFTDNTNRRILKTIEFGQDYHVVALVPREKVYTKSVSRERIRSIAPLVRYVFELGMSGRLWEALTLNGLLYSAALGANPAPAIDALQAGAMASGLSGTGPAVIAVVDADKLDAVVEAWEAYEADVLICRTNRRKAKQVVIGGC